MTNYIIIIYLAHRVKESIPQSELNMTIFYYYMKCETFQVDGTLLKKNCQVLYKMPVPAAWINRNLT